jgi:hypothetical protein
MPGFCAHVQQSTCVELGQRPNGVTNYARIDGTPEVLAALLAVLGIAVLGQLAVVSGRRCQHDFAILKALGLLRRQVREITAWQATILAGLALLIGVPLGLAAGRWSWQLFSHGVGIPADARVPGALVLVMVPDAQRTVCAISDFCSQEALPVLIRRSSGIGPDWMCG